MEETKEQQKIYSIMQYILYFIVLLDIIIHLYSFPDIFGNFYDILQRTAKINIFSTPLSTKLFSVLFTLLVGIGAVAKKDTKIQPTKHIAIPMSLGLILVFSSLYFLTEIQNQDTMNYILPYTSWYHIGYISFSLVGIILTVISIDNISKMFKSNLGKDKWNIEGESFMQQIKPNMTPYSVNIPMQFYYKGKVRNGFINIVNPFRGTMVIGTPGSGKSFGVVNPFIRQLIDKEFTMCIYDFKFPDLGKIAYYHYCLAKKAGKLKNYKFHVVNLDNIEKSRRINPLRKDYIQTLADAQEISQALVEALKKGDKSSGSDQFFTQSAVNLLAAAVYFLSKYENGQYSSLPHLLSLLTRPYADIFKVLFTNTEIHSLLAPFMTAYKNKTFETLDGQIGTLLIFLSRLATKETYWVFSGDDFNLKISDNKEPGILVLANDPSTQDINSACYTVIVNRLTRLINSKGNKPTAIIADEFPTIYFHKMENLIATARSNKVAVLMGLQELPQFKLIYGKDTASTITSVVGNVLSGSVRNKETLDWMERIFGKSKQIGESLSIDRKRTSVSLNEKLEALIPAGKIASLKAGEMVGIIADDANAAYSGNYETSAVHCKINLNMSAIAAEERGYKPTPDYYSFNGNKEKLLFQNFEFIKKQIDDIINSIPDKKP